MCVSSRIQVGGLLAIRRVLVQQQLSDQPQDVTLWALYGRKCRTPLNWSQTGDSRIFGTNLMLEAEKQVKEIQDRLRAAMSRQKSYYDTKHREVNFEPGEYVYLRVTPMRGVRRLQTRGKLAPRYVGPFPIMAKRGKVVYQLELPPEMADIHDVFHVSQLRKCVSPPVKQVDVKELE